MSITLYKYRTITFEAGGSTVTIDARFAGMDLVIAVSRDGVPVERRAINAASIDSLYNQRFAVPLADGRTLDLETGYIGWWRYGAMARLDGAVVHESHPGQRVGPPGGLDKKMAAMGMTGDSETQRLAWERNKVPLAIDLATGLIFFVVARVWGLQTAAMVGIAIGVGLVVAQRFVKTDILGGLALFGIAMLAVSAGIAWFLNDDVWIKLRGSVVGLIAAAIFLGDGLIFRGEKLAAKLLRYLPQFSLDARRMAIGMGATGAIMAGINAILATQATTETWLWYKTFGDTVVGLALFFVMLRFARVRKPSG